MLYVLFWFIQYSRIKPGVANYGRKQRTSEQNRSSSSFGSFPILHGPTHARDRLYQSRQAAGPVLSPGSRGLYPVPNSSPQGPEAGSAAMKVELDFPEEFWGVVKRVAATIGVPPELFLVNRLIGVTARDAAFFEITGQPPKYLPLEFQKRGDEWLTGDELLGVLLDAFREAYRKTFGADKEIIWS